MSARSIALALALAVLAGSARAQLPAASCYAPSIPMPPVRTQTIVLIDLTTPVVDTVVDGFQRTVLQAAQQPGQRFVILSFAGLAAGQRLRAHLDYVVEAPIEDDEQKERLLIAAFRKSQKCVSDALAAWPRIAATALTKAMASHGGADFQRSEIIYALSETVRSFAAPGMTTQILVYGDGLQTGSGTTFYGRDRRPRRIDAEAELARLSLEAKAPLAPQRSSVSVLWWGLLLQKGEAADSGYHDSQTIEQLRSFWSKLLLGWGVRDVQIGQTLLNPRLQSQGRVGAAAAGNGG
jgi:hypothetical protein